MSAIDTEHRRLCHALFDAIEQGDLAAVEACYAPEMTMWFNGTGQESTRADNLAALAKGKTMFGTKRTQSARVPTQVRLANLQVEIDFAETLMRDIAARMQAHADGTIDLDLLTQQKLRLGIAHVVRRCRDAIREILASSGASAHYLDHELQRLHRDIHMISAHTVFDVDLVAEGVGRAIVAAHETDAN